MSETRIAAPIELRLLPESPEWDKVQPGDMWLCPWLIDEQIKDDGGLLSPQYHSEIKPKRAPVCIALPGGAQWMPETRASNGGGYWSVSGELPKITANPSIQTHNWHGWLRDGQLVQA